MEHVRSYVRSDMKILNPDYEKIRLFIQLCNIFPIYRGGGYKIVDKCNISAYIIKGECIYSLKKFEKSCNLYRWNDLYKCQENVNGTNC